MTSKTAYQKFRIRLNKLGTSFNKEISTVEFCEVFNKAQLYWFDKQIEIVEKSISEVINVQHLTETVTKRPLKSDKFYSIDFPEDYYTYRRVSVLATKECEQWLEALPVSENNVGRLLQNEHIKPSFEWEETIFSVAKDKIKVYYTDFDIKRIELTYFKTPIQIDIESGENNIYGDPSKDVDPNHPDSVIEEIIDIAVAITSGDIGDYNRQKSLITLQ